MNKNRLISSLKSLRLRHLLLDVALISLSLFLSVYLRVGPDTGDYLPVIYFYWPIFIGVKLVTFFMFNVYNFIWRYVSARDAFRLSQAVALSSGILLAISFLISEKFGVLPRSVYFIDALLLTGFMMGARLARRLIFEARQEIGPTQAPGVRSLIFGAGTHGKSLAAQLRDRNSGYSLVGFVDDDPKKHGLALDGMRVWGGVEDLESIIESLEIKELFIAGSLPVETLRNIVTKASRFNVKPRVTSAYGKAAGDANLRRVSLSDLLNRGTRAVERDSVEQLFKGKKVLVTGAGGSIGAEICRQVLKFNPGRLFLLDHSEYNLFSIDKELRVSTQNFDHVVPLLVDVKDNSSLSSIFKKYSPDIVIHAAAYKHVHLVEANPYSAILNNVYGTQQLLDLCLLNKVDEFVLISTDKAVNPVGVMGATKRICELLTTLAAIRSGKNYCSVRFGNVLGSSGSLIPTLQQQIEEGGPVTVTHKDMTRFFMLIPEAVSLVLKAATISAPGDVNILKMGEPVKILDIAKNLIALSGKTEEEIPIVFTGTRPGEKLFEELYIRGDELKTEDPDILTLPNGDSELSQFKSGGVGSIEQKINEMIVLSQQSDELALKILNELVKSSLLIQSASRHP